MSRRYTIGSRTRLRERALAGVRARAAKRLAAAGALRDVGGFTTDGCLGQHTVRLLAWPDAPAGKLAVTVDGQHRQARTFRGVLRCLAHMVAARSVAARRPGQE